MSASAGKLARLQADLARCLVDGTALEPETIVPGGTLGREQALEVYRRGYFIRLTEQLGETYESVWWLLGDELFFEVCRRFIAATSSRSYNLSDYGESFADFLAALPEEVCGTRLGAERELLPHVARLEWRFKDLFHAAEHVHVPAAELAAIGDLTGVRFELGSAVAMIDAPLAVGEVFARRKDPPDARLELDWRRPQHLLLYKLGGDVFLRELDAPAMAVVRSLAAGAAVEEALAAGAACSDAFGPEQAAAVFDTLARCGLVAAVL